MTIRKGLSRMLTTISPEYELVGMASNGLEGIEVIEEQRPDLVVLDIQMPKMDGLTMLEEVRKRGIPCKAMVLTAYSDFNYARKAIELGIENYLLKPIRISELKRALSMICESVEREKGEGSLLSLEQIVRACVLGEMEVDERLDAVTKTRYGLGIHDRTAVLSVWLSTDYDILHGQVELLLAEVCGRDEETRCCIVASERFSLIVMLLYGFDDEETVRKHYASSVIPMLCGRIKTEVICTWKTSEGLADLKDTFSWLLDARNWNLNFKRGTLITQDAVEYMQPAALKYPMELENQAKQMLIDRDRDGFSRCFELFQQICGEEDRRIEDIRATYERYCIALLSVARNVGSVKHATASQPLLKKIADALTWREFREVMMDIYTQVTLDKEEAADVSLLVKRARQLIEEYYDQGITLEEISEKLCVSEEYLSSLFKKETGATFTETIRGVRIEKVKELLLHSNLKLNQISDMVGYSDPKYMSKVFRETVGMLPAEFRKTHK